MLKTASKNVIPSPSCDFFENSDLHIIVITPGAET